MTVDDIRRRYRHRDERKVLYDRHREEVLTLLKRIEELESEEK